ncbi:hypothetical protein EVAR_39864_1 [Eumeta japonica]|uniref:Uncharacterized protein n=1 Tax=Eumeta variegata TaxID=151549 RepID=A0A4C1WS99_EUMVA|nr:hypothetical protein EVAR_39864_1 [Eumeta japonica]
MAGHYALSKAPCMSSDTLRVEFFFLPLLSEVYHQVIEGVLGLALRHESILPIIKDWYPRDGKRKRGRQHRRWEDKLKLTAGPNWRRVARDRKQWKMLEEAFANKHTELRDIL